MPIHPDEAHCFLDGTRTEDARSDELVEQLFGKQLGVDTRALTGRHPTPSFAEIGERFRALNFLAKPKFLRAVARQLAPAATQALSDVALRPYQSGYARQPFRSPNDEGLLDVWRGQIIWTGYSLGQRFERPASFVAEWMGYLQEYQIAAGLLLAGAIDSGDDDTLQVLMQTVHGEHPTAAISSPAIRALLACGKAEAWEAVEKLLLAAGRSDGLRQVILEAIDETHPRVLPRFLRFIVEHDLMRFSSTYRALAVLIPGLPEEGELTSATQAVGRIVDMLNDSRLEPTRGDAQDVYLRLWTDAFADIRVALKRASRLCESPSAAERLSACRLVGQLRITSGFPLLKRFLVDDDRRVASSAILSLGAFSSEQLSKGSLAPILRTVAQRWPHPPPQGLVKREAVWDMYATATPEGDPRDVAANVHELSVDGRLAFAQTLKNVVDVRLRRDTAIKLLSDAGRSVRKAAFRSLTDSNLDEEDVPFIEDLLRKKSSDMRLAAMSLLRKQAPAAIVASIERLTASSSPEQRGGGCELLAQLYEAGIAKERLRQVANSLGASPKPLAARDRACLDRVIGESEGGRNDLDSGLGLYDPLAVYFAPKPSRAGAGFESQAAHACIQSLDDVIDAHRNEPLRVKRRHDDGVEKVLIGELVHGFWPPSPRESYEQQRGRYPLADLTESWMDGRGTALYDPDGLELVRALILLNEDKGRPAAKGSGLRHQVLLGKCLPWLVRRALPSLNPNTLLDLLSDLILDRDDGDYEAETNRDYFGLRLSWREAQDLEATVEIVTERLATDPAGQNDVRLYQLARYIDEPFGRAGRPGLIKRSTMLVSPTFSPPVVGKRLRPPARRPCRLSILERAFDAGGCSDTDVLDQLAIGTAFGISYGRLGPSSLLGRGTRLDAYPLLAPLAAKVIGRVVEIEAERGELPTAVTELALDIEVGIHLPQVALLLSKGCAATRRAGLDKSKASVFSHLLTYSKPAPDETPSVCAEAFKKSGAKEARLIELAMASPQWAPGVELALGWDGFVDAIWWMHAHTKDEYWGATSELKEMWQGEVSERTPLDFNRLMEGATDVAWYHRFRTKLSQKQWEAIDRAAKYASTGSGHVRAQLFAKTMDGTTSVADLEARIRVKRHGDAVRAYGLAPLGVNPREEVKGRYKLLHSFLMESRQFGSMRQASEKLAYTIALENLAWTAGYPDPLRLIWAIEAAESIDVAGEGKIKQVGDIVVRLYINELGEPVIEATKAGKVLADVPAATKKEPEIKAFLARKTEFRKQAQRMRLALEQAMQRGDQFEPDELVGLMANPVLAPLLQNLVFIEEGGSAGFLSREGRLEGGSGKAWIAHPFDLLERGDWSDWRGAVFSQVRVQPFKQVFRELYVLTENEQERVDSRRYAGHQVNPRQALAILGKRGWLLRHEEGLSKTLHELRLTARLEFEENFFSPADAEGLTIENLRFTKAGQWDPLPLASIPPKAFSETMRDLDLIVSVASLVGIDPEASESTTEMRASVVREMALLMGLGNISIHGRSVVVRGSLGEYSIHLGSGTVHQRTRGELVIIAVRQPQRGRLFLPFMDDDPRTAEVVSKVLLLAKDDAIKDPRILSQIVSERR